MKFLLRIVIVLLFLIGFSIGNASPIALEKVDTNISDQATLLRGAKFFAQNCMVCHTMKYVQHNPLAKAAGITLDKMPLKNQSWLLGIVPPDLSLIAAQKGANWLYTYFHAFYKDDSRPTKYNNLLMKDVNMTNIFAPFQGDQVIVSDYQKNLATESLTKPHYYSVLRLERQGAMTPEQFDQTMTDLVSFLVYVSEPHAAFRRMLGIWVVLFLAAFAVVAYLLKKSYWEEVHKKIHH